MNNHYQERDEVRDKSSFYYPIFEHMSVTHGLTLLDSEIEDIITVCDKVRMSAGGVSWILVNALCHLDSDQLQTLAEEILKRINTPTQSGKI